MGPDSWIFINLEYFFPIGIFPMNCRLQKMVKISENFGELKSWQFLRLIDISVAVLA